MDNIPEDITKAARRVYDALGRGSVSDSEHIARALLAQDRAATERAAKRIENYEPSDFIGWDERSELAAAIRQP